MEEKEVGVDSPTPSVRWRRIPTLYSLYNGSTKGQLSSESHPLSGLLGIILQVLCLGSHFWSAWTIFGGSHWLEMPGAHKGPSPSPFLMQDDVVLEEHPLDEKGEEANEDLESFLEENFKEKAQGPIAGTEAIGFWWMQYVHILKLLLPWRGSRQSIQSPSLFEVYSYL